MTSCTPTGHRSEALRRNNVHCTGPLDGPALVLSHGFGCDQTMWRHVLPAFEAERRVVLPDHVGAGGSDRSQYDVARHFSLRGYAADLVEVVEALGAGPVDHVGHSAGAMIGLLASLARPELFRSLVLVGGSPRYLDDTDYRGGFTRHDVDEILAAIEADLLTWSRGIVPVVVGDGPARAELADSFARTDARTAVELARAIFLSDHRDVLGAVRVPTLVVQSAEDPMVPAEVAGYLHAAIPGSELVVLAATGHYPHLSAPAETVRVIGEFLGRVSR